MAFEGEWVDVSWSLGANPDKLMLVWLKGCDGGLDKPMKLSRPEKALGRAVIGSTCRTYKSP